MNRRLLTVPKYGPRLHVDGLGRTSLWAIADPARGPALGICVHIRWERGRCVFVACDKVPATPIATDRWSPLPAPAIDADRRGAIACLLLYDWPALEGDGFADADATSVLLDAEGITNALSRVDVDNAGLPKQGTLSVDRFVRATRFLQDSAQLVFAVGSCQYPATPLNENVAHASLGRLAGRIADLRHAPLDFLLLLGDQIYADATAGLMDASQLHERYARKYQAYFGIPALADILKSAPTYMMLDDHEISVDCEPPYEGVRAAYLEEGLAAYWGWQRMCDPLPTLWFEAFATQEAGLFVLDTRLARELRTVRTYRKASILGHAQTEALKAWLLSREPSSLKLIGSASMLLPRHRDNSDCTIRLDGWDGYPASLHEILAFICDHRIDNVAFLCGDEHLSCVARIEVSCDDRSVRVLSIESSAFHAPFEFANGRESNLIADDRWSFASGGKQYVCTVQTDFPRMGDGYFEIGCRQRDLEWSLYCRFDGAAGSWAETYSLAIPGQGSRTSVSLGETR